ncbi:MAG: hypothetical protein R6V76_08520 [Desulfobacterales bacterium]
MNKMLKGQDNLGNHLGCFGNFSIKDMICKKFCALSLRCYIEKDQNSKIEIIEEIVFSENTFKGKLQ